MYYLTVYHLFMMDGKNNNFETPTKKPPKRSYWYSYSPLKRATKDLFGGGSEIKTQQWKEFFDLCKNPEHQELLADREQEKAGDS